MVSVGDWWLRVLGFDPYQSLSFLIGGIKSFEHYIACHIKLNFFMQQKKKRFWKQFRKVVDFDEMPPVFKFKLVDDEKGSCCYDMTTVQMLALNRIIILSASLSLTLKDRLE